MQLIDFTQTFKPTNNLVLLVRDDKVYRYCHAVNTYYSIFDNYKFLDKTKPTDIIYEFPDETSLYKTLRAGQCLDTFKITREKEYRPDVVRKLIENGKLVGVHYTDGKRRIVKNYDKLIGKDEDGKTYLTINWGSGTGDLIKFYEFDNEYEFFKWFLPNYADKVKRSILELV